MFSSNALIACFCLCVVMPAVGAEPANFKKDKAAFDKSFALNAEDLLPIPPRLDGRKQLVVIEYPASVADDALEKASTAYAKVCNADGEGDPATLTKALVRTKYVAASLLQTLQKNLGEQVVVLAMPQVIGNFALGDELGVKNLIPDAPRADAYVNLLAYVDACKNGQAGSFAQTVVPGVLISAYFKEEVDSDLARRVLVAGTDRLLSAYVNFGGRSHGDYSAIMPLLNNDDRGRKDFKELLESFYYVRDLRLPEDDSKKKAKREPLPFFYQSLPYQPGKILVLPTAATKLEDDKAAGRYLLMDAPVFIKLIRSVLYEQEKMTADKSQWHDSHVQSLYPIVKSIGNSSAVASPNLLSFIEATRNLEIQWLQRFLNDSLHDQFIGAFGQSVTEEIGAEATVKSSTWKALGVGLVTATALAAIGMDTTSAGMQGLSVSSQIESQSHQQFEEISSELSSELSKFTLDTGAATSEITASTHAALRQALKDKYVQVFEANEAAVP